MASDEHGQFRFFANTSLKYAEMPMYKGFPMGEVWIEHLTQTSLTPHSDLTWFIENIYHVGPIRNWFGVWSEVWVRSE